MVKPKVKSSLLVSRILTRVRQQSSVQLLIRVAAGYTEKSFTWTVKCNPDCSAPYALHIVNALGQGQELTNGGFWGIYYWIAPENAASSTSSSTSSSTTKSTSTSSTTTSKSGTASSTAGSGQNNQGKSSSDGKTIGIGVGVGVGVAAILIASALFWWRRRHRKTKEANTNFTPVATNDPGAAIRWGESWQPMSEVSGISRLPAEAPGNVKSPIEAPSHRDPYELPTDRYK